MIQLIVFFIAFGILVANGAGVIGAFLGAIVISFILSIIITAIFIGLSDN